MAIPNNFSLFIPRVFCNDTFVSKSHKLNKIVEGFTHSGRMVHLASEIRLSNISKEVSAADDFA